MRITPLAIGAILLCFAACAKSDDGEINDDEGSLCVKSCQCAGFCSEKDVEECRTEDQDLADEADEKDCRKLLNAYTSCIEDLKCEDGLVDESDCSGDYSALNKCLHPAPACATTKDGVCDEPE